MSLTECVCGGVPLNSGISGCIETVGVWDYIVRVDQEDSSGTDNFIPGTQTIDSAYVQGKLNNTDPTVKWTVFPKLWNVLDERADPLTEEQDNITFNLRQGPRTFTANFRGKAASPQMEATWMSFECRSTAVFGLTEFGQIVGMNPNLAGDLYPIKVEDGTWFAKYMPPKKAPEDQKVMVYFTFDETETDSALDFISSQDVAYATSGWYSDAPIDILGFEVSNSGQDTIVIKLKERFGGANKKNDIKGIVIGDFSPDEGSTTSAVFNVTQSANVVLSGVTSATVNGELQYTLSLPIGQNTSDVISIDVFKTGYDQRDPLLVTLN